MAASLVCAALSACGGTDTASSTSPPGATSPRGAPSAGGSETAPSDAASGDSGSGSALSPPGPGGATVDDAGASASAGPQQGPGGGGTAATDAETAAPPAGGGTEDGSTVPNGATGNPGGAGDANAPPSPGDGGTVGCGSATFCDGFEGATTLSANWGVDSTVPANVVEVVTGKAHSGTNSVHITFATTAGQTFIHEKVGFPLTGTSWGRVWLNIATAVNTSHCMYIEATTGVNLVKYGVRPLNTQGDMSVNVSPPDNGVTSTMPLVRNTWTCFEWQITGAGGTGSVVLYANGTLVTSISGMPIPATLIEQRVGYEHNMADTAGGEMWIDDYAIGSTRIGCN